MCIVVDMGDLFHQLVPDEFILQTFEVMGKRQDVDFQVLTKRARRMAELFHGTKLPKNIWIGATAENQAMADARIPELLKVDAAVRFLSVEPMLEPITLDLSGIDWVICGGESGG
jgi:protein gp37